MSVVLNDRTEVKEQNKQNTINGLNQELSSFSFFASDSSINFTNLSVLS